jgi:RNA polymerase sigma-70 factor (ECF subfamily)
MKNEVTPEILELILQAQAGNTSALKDLITQTQPRLLKFLLYLTSNEQLAQDLCQDSFLKVLSNLSSLRDPKSFYSWLFRSAKNLYLDHIKSAKSRESTSLEEVSDLSLFIYEEADKDSLILFRKVLSQIETDYQVVILLVDIEGYSYSEAADIVGISEDSLRSRLHRARQDFANFFEKLKTN